MVSDFSAHHPAPERPTSGELRRLIALVAQRQIRPLSDGILPHASHPSASEILSAVSEPDGVTWLYPWGVTLYGLLRAAHAIGESSISDFVHHHNRIAARYFVWLRQFGQVAGGLPEVNSFITRSRLRFLLRLANSNDCGAMGNQMLAAVIDSPANETPEQRAVLDYVADWIIHRQSRLPDGTFIWKAEQTEGQTVGLGAVVWSDDLFMSCPFLVRWASRTGDATLVDDAAWQIVRQSSLMQDRDGLWFHGYLWDWQRPAPYKWGRANGWAMLAIVEVLAALPEEHPSRELLLRSLRRHVAGLAAAQTVDGRWRQVLDQPGLWAETSCSAMLCYGIARAINRRWIERDYEAVAWHAFTGVRNQITSSGIIQDCCTGTDISLELGYYADRPRPDDEAHGPGTVLLAATELLALAASGS